MWWTKFILLMTITIGVTWSIVWVDSQLKKKADTKGMTGPFRGFVYLILNLRDVL